jgi:hypothetical protein
VVTDVDSLTEGESRELDSSMWSVLVLIARKGLGIILGSNSESEL